MKKHSLYLREDQTAFLKSLSNASGFMRECLDVAISSERGSTEKTICLYEGAKELEAKITELTTRDFQIEEDAIYQDFIVHGRK